MALLDIVPSNIDDNVFLDYQLKYKDDPHALFLLKTIRKLQKENRSLKQTIKENL